MLDQSFEIIDIIYGQDFIVSDDKKRHQCCHHLKRLFHVTLNF